MKLKPILSLAAAMALTFNVSALTITPGGASYSGNDNSNLSAAEISAILNANGFGPVSLQEKYKQDVGAGSDTGPFASSYQTVFSNSSGDPADADITYVGGASLAGVANLWLYVKDGNHEPAYYLINLSAWNGTDSLNLRNFWPQQGAISHVTILGGNGTNNIPGVPDGGMTVMLLGAGLAGLGAVRRFVKI